MDIDTILQLSKTEKYIMLKSPSFRKSILEHENHYQFIQLIQGLKEELLYILDDDLIPLLERTSRKVDKIIGIITCGNHFANIFLKKETLIKMIINDHDIFHYYISSLDLSFAREYFKYLYNNKLSLYYLRGLNTDNELEVIKENINLLTTKNIDINILLILNKKSIEYLLEKIEFQNILLEARIDYIDIIIRKNVKLPTNLMTNKELIDKYLKIENINKFYEYMSSLDINNTYLKEEILTKRRIYYTKKINNFNIDLNIFNDYISILNGKNTFHDFSVNYEVSKFLSEKDKLLSFLQELTITKMLEMTVDAFYQDLTYNFLKNVKSILEYTVLNPQINIPKERLEIYKLFLDYYNLSSIDRINLYNKLNNGVNHAEEFYDDFRECKSKSYNEIKSSLIDLEKKEKIGVIEDIDVYKYDGEEFKMLVTKVNFPREEENSSGKIWWEKKHCKATSSSLISDKNITTFGNPIHNVILGFSNFNPNNILITYHADAYTTEDGSQKISSFYTPDGLINATKTYNEIQISEKYELLVPSYVVCYDEIKVGDIMASKLLEGIPLVIIDTKKYTYKKDGFISADKDKYISSFEAYKNISYRKR